MACEKDIAQLSGGTLVVPNLRHFVYFVYFVVPVALSRMNAGHESVFTCVRRLLRGRAGLAVFLLWGLSATAHAQNSLLSALSQDAIVQPRQNSLVDLRPDQPHWGPVQFTLGAYARADYNDNIYLAQNNPQADTLLRGGLSLGFFWPATDQSTLSFGTSVGYVKYVINSVNSGFEITPDSALSYVISLSEGSLAFFDQLSDSREVLAEPALANIGTLPLFQNTIGTRGTWEPSKLTLEAGYSHNDTLSEGNTSYLNSSSEYLFGRGGWRFAEATQAGVEASGGLTTYQQSSQSDTTSISLGGYFDWQVRSTLHAVLRGGPAFFLLKSAAPGGGESTLSSYYFNLELDHRLTDFFSNSLSIAHFVRPGINQGSDYIEQFSATYSLGFDLTRQISLGANAVYQHGSQPLVVLIVGPFALEQIENYDLYGGGPQLSWHLTEKTATTLSYAFFQRTSNLPGRSYCQNIVSLSIRYTF